MSDCDFCYDKQMSALFSSKFDDMSLFLRSHKPIPMGMEYG